VPARELDERTPQQAKSLLASLQRGWERGRQEETPDSSATVRPEDAGGGTRGQR
jgi:hypothetical protein